jgi:PTH2 family peptidyl-tRNA hydrolase
MKEFNVKQVIVIRKDLNMRCGKLAAQVSHASLASVLDKMNIGNFNEPQKIQIRTLTIKEESPMYEWLNGSFAKIVVYVENETELNNLMNRAKEKKIQVTPIVDSGNTEFHGVPTLTCAAFGPDYKDKLDELTGNLKLY